MSVKEKNGVSALNKLMAISPIDGRYATKTSILSPLLGEYGLMRSRLEVEIEWLLTLAKKPELIGNLNSEEIESNLSNLLDGFSEKEAKRIKQLESVINHDVKAVEYYYIM